MSGSKNTALAVAAHPDDIELMMGGTFILLGRHNWELHYHTIANGSCGSADLDAAALAAVRREEAESAAAAVGAQFHPAFVNDFEIIYSLPLLQKLTALVREVKPTIVLLPSPQDYMEDHMNASRLMVSACFARAMRNFKADPPVEPDEWSMALYHALPWGLCDQLRKPVIPDFYVDVETVMAEKRRMLSCHKSQKEWLDHSQGLDNYLTTMEAMTAEAGRLSGKYVYVEGWRRHHHLGFGSEDYDPLCSSLKHQIHQDIGGRCHA